MIRIDVQPGALLRIASYPGMALRVTYTTPTIIGCIDEKDEGEAWKRISYGFGWCSIDFFIEHKEIKLLEPADPFLNIPKEKSQ